MIPLVKIEQGDTGASAEELHHKWGEVKCTTAAQSECQTKELCIWTHNREIMKVLSLCPKGAHNDISFHICYFFVSFFVSLFLSFFIYLSVCEHSTGQTSLSSLLFCDLVGQGQRGQ